MWACGFGILGCWPVGSMLYFGSLLVGLLFVVIASVSLTSPVFGVNIQLRCVHFSDCFNIIYCHICFVWWFYFYGYIVIGIFFFLVTYPFVVSSVLTVFSFCVTPVLASVSLCSVFYSIFWSFHHSWDVHFIFLFLTISYWLINIVVLSWASSHFLNFYIVDFIFCVVCVTLPYLSVKTIPLYFLHEIASWCTSCGHGQYCPIVAYHLCSWV